MATLLSILRQYLFEKKKKTILTRSFFNDEFNLAFKM